jgi:RimJ/RimL family protein N-acetyltransferase
MSLLPITDEASIIALLQKDELYKQLLNEEDVNNLSVDLKTQYWFIVVDDEIQEAIGMFLIIPFIGKCVSFHGGMYKEFRGRNTVQIVRQCLESIAPETDVVFMTTVKNTNKQAIALVEKLGLEYKGTIPGGYTNADMLIYSEV